MAMYRSTQMVAQYVDSVRITNPDLDHKAVGVALCNLGEGAEQENLEVPHTRHRLPVIPPRMYACASALPADCDGCRQFLLRSDC